MFCCYPSPCVCQVLVLYLSWYELCDVACELEEACLKCHNQNSPKTKGRSHHDSCHEGDHFQNELYEAYGNFGECFAADDHQRIAWTCSKRCTHVHHRRKSDYQLEVLKDLTPESLEEGKKYIAENLIYPEEAKRQGIRGRVLVVTGIDRDGTVKVLGIEKSVHPLLDEEAKRVISSMPKWKPGIKDGKPMRLKITIPINFGVAEHSIDELDRKPEFPGGFDVCIKYLAVNVKYPKEAAKRKIQGRVIVDFVVNKDGSITDVNVVKPVHYLLDEEAVRVVKTMPKWNPGILDGKPVRVKYSLPITFRIPESLSAR